MNETKKLKTYICQFCKKEYQSDGERKPKSYKKDGSTYQYYDSTLFCSKECCKRDTIEKLKQTYKNHPEIIEKRVEKRKQTLKDHPEVVKKQAESRKQTLKNHPKIVEQMSRKISQTLKQTYKDHPEIMKQVHKKRLQTLKNSPEIIERQREKLRQILKNNPEIVKRAMKKREQTYKEHPEIIEQRKETYRQTLRNNPEIMRKSHQKLKQTLKNHPEIVEQSRDKAYQTMKLNGFISKPEQQMIQLLRNKYGKDDVIEQYRDDRYMRPNSNYRYSCDCYIKSLDLFIEYNGSRFHPTEENREELEQEIKNFQLKYPNKDIKECQAFTLLDTIEKDKIKQQVANDNKLNYLTVTEGFKELYDKNIL